MDSATPVLLMLRGLPASGKSTFAKALVKANPTEWKRVSKDDLRDMLHAGEWSELLEGPILRARDALIVCFLKSQRCVVVDDTNLAPKHEARLRQLAQEFGATFQIKAFELDPDEAIRRDAARERPVGEKVIRSMHERFLAPGAAQTGT